MHTSPLKLPSPEEDAIECWDDDEDLQCGEDIQVRTVSTATSVTGFSAVRSGRRDSISSRRSGKSDLESSIGDDESWQVLLQENDEHAIHDAVTSAKNAGIPIPEDAPKSALLGGTIKRLGDRKMNKKATGDDWSEDLDFAGSKGKLELRMYRETASPDSLSQLSPLASDSPDKGRNGDSTFSFDGSPSPSIPVIDSLEKFRDNDDDSSFLDVPTIKVPKSRTATSPAASHPPEPNGRDESFEKDLEFPPDDQPLHLSTRTNVLRTPDLFPDDIETESAEGSIGARFGSTKREEPSNRSSSISMLSPSLSSCLTAESEDDALEGLVLPDGPLDLEGSLQKTLQSVDNKECSPPDQSRPSTKQPDSSNNDDFFADIDIGDGEVFDSAKLTLNRNIKHKREGSTTSARRPSTSVTFTNKSTSHTRIPRLTGQERPHSTHLEPVSESGAPVSSFQRSPPPVTGHTAHSSLTNIPLPSTQTLSGFPNRSALGKRTSRDGLRSELTSTSSPSIKSKQSVPVMRSANHSSVASQQHQQSPSRQETATGLPHYIRPKTPINRTTDAQAATSRYAHLPSIPTRGSQSQSYGAGVNADRHHRGAGSESSCDSQRTTSKLSSSKHPESPRRNDGPRNPLAAAAKQPVTKPTRRKHFGNGTELDIFDDLPTSTTTESNFMKVPIKQGAPRSARSKPSQSNIAIPQPDTPASVAPPMSPAGPDFTPRFARDTNASRNARQQRLAPVPLNQREREAVPLAPLSTNWRAQNTQNPLGSPTFTRPRKRKNIKDSSKPQLIKPIGTGAQEAKCKCYIYSEGFPRCRLSHVLILMIPTMQLSKECDTTRVCANGKAMKMLLRHLTPPNLLSFPMSEALEALKSWAEWSLIRRS